jgi:hypothetical protein
MSWSENKNNNDGMSINVQYVTITLISMTDVTCAIYRFFVSWPPTAKKICEVILDMPQIFLGQKNLPQKFKR